MNPTYRISSSRLDIKPESAAQQRHFWHEAESPRQINLTAWALSGEIGRSEANRGGEESEKEDALSPRMTSHTGGQRSAFASTRDYAWGVVAVGHTCFEHPEHPSGWPRGWLKKMPLLRLFCVAVLTGAVTVDSDPAQNIPGQNKDPRVFIDSPMPSTGLLPPCLREGPRRYVACPVSCCLLYATCHVVICSGSLNSPSPECTIVVRTRGTFQMCTGTQGPEGASPADSPAETPCGVYITTDSMYHAGGSMQNCNGHRRSR